MSSNEVVGGGTREGMGIPLKGDLRADAREHFHAQLVGMGYAVDAELAAAKLEVAARATTESDPELKAAMLNDWASTTCTSDPSEPRREDGPAERRSGSARRRSRPEETRRTPVREASPRTLAAPW
jgi:hypothetical protein